MKLEKTIAPPNSIIFISDPTHPEQASLEVGNSLISATRSCVSVGTLAEMDGATTVRLARHFDEIEGDVAFEGCLETPGRKIAVSDTLGNLLLEMAVSSCLTRVTVWANDINEPDVILIRAD